MAISPGTECVIRLNAPEGSAYAEFIGKRCKVVSYHSDWGCYAVSVEGHPDNLLVTEQELEAPRA